MLRTPVFKVLQIGVVALLVLAFTISAAGAQPAQAAPFTASQLSSGWIPFSGYFPSTNIHLNGLVHIVSHWTGVTSSEAQVDVSVNLPADNVTVTTDTGTPYIASGAGQSSIFFPADPVRVIVPAFLMVVGSDRALPPNPVLPPNPIQPFGLQIDLVFSAAGVLDFNASTVQVIKLPGLGDG